MHNLENLDVFEILITQNFDYTKSAKMPEGPFCQIGAHIYLPGVLPLLFTCWGIFKVLLTSTKSVQN